MSRHDYLRFTDEISLTTNQDVTTVSGALGPSPGTRVNLFLEEFSAWRAEDDNKLSVAFADAKMDLMWGLLQVIDVVHWDNEFIIDPYLQHVLKCKAYGFATDEVELDALHETRWNALARKTLKNMGEPRRGTSMFSHVLWFGALFNAMRIYPVILWACMDKITDALLDIVHDRSVLYSVKKDEKDTFELVIDANIWVMLNTAWYQMEEQMLGFEGPFKDVQFVITLPEKEATPTRAGADYTKQLKLISTDLQICKSFKGYLKQRTERRATIFEYAYRAAEADFVTDQVYIEACSSRQTVTITAAERLRTDVYINTMAGLHKQRILEEFSSWVVYLPEEAESLSHLSADQQPGVYIKQVDSARIRDFIALAQTRFPRDLAAERQNALNRFYQALFLYRERGERMLWKVYNVLPDSLVKSIQMTIWDSRDDLPLELPVLVGVGHRPLIHPIEYVIYFSSHPGRGRVHLVPPARQGNAIHPPEDISMVHTRLRFLLIEKAALTMSEVDHNHAVLHLSRHLLAQESKWFNDRNTRNKRRNPTRKVKDDENFMVSLQMIVNKYVLENHLYVNWEVDEALLTQLSIFELDIAEPSVLLACLLRNSTLVDVPAGYDDTDQLVLFLRNLPVATRHVGINWDNYRINVARCNTAEPMARILKMSHYTDLWSIECGTYRNTMLGHPSIELQPLPLDMEDDRGLTAESTFIVESRYVSLPDNVLFIDPVYFYARRWFMLQPLPNEMAATAANHMLEDIMLSDMWMVEAHENATPRPLGVFTYDYFRTQPRVLRRPEGADVLIPTFLTISHQNFITREGPEEERDWPDMVCKPLQRNDTTRIVQSSFYPARRPLDTKRKEYGVRNPADDDYVSARATLWSGKQWCQPLQSVGDGLWFFKAHNYFVPHGSPLPFMSPEVLKTGARLADHEINNYLGYYYLAYVDNNYKLGKPDTDCAALRYLQENDKHCGVIEMLLYSFYFPCSSPLKMVTLIAAKYDHLQILKPSKVFKERSAADPTLRGRALHEQMIQTAGDVTIPVFHITCRLRSNIIPIVTPALLVAALGVDENTAGKYAEAIQHSRGEIRALETDVHDRAVNFDLACAIMADNILQLLDLMGFDSEHRRWIEYRPLVCTVRAELLMQFPFLKLNELQRARITAILEYLPPVPQTHAMLVTPTEVMKTSVYPLMIGDSAYMFVADRYRDGKWNSHDHANFSRPAAEQAEYCTSVRANSIVEPNIQDYTSSPVVYTGSQGHLAAAMVNLRSKIVSNRQLAAWMSLPTGASVDLYMQAIIRQTNVSSIGSVRISACTPSRSRTTMPCGCAFSTIMSVFTCKTETKLLLRMIKQQFMRPFVYHAILKALLALNLTDLEIEQISRSILPARDPQARPEALENCMDPFNPILKNYILSCPILVFVDMKTVAYFARQSSPEEYARWEDACIDRFLLLHDDKAPTLDFIVAEATALCMALDYLGIIDNKIRRLAYYKECGYEIDYDHKSSLRVLTNDRILPLLAERRDPLFAQLGEAEGSGDRPRVKIIKKELKKWEDAMESISKFRKSKDLASAVVDILMEKDWEASADSIRCLWRCKNVVLWGQRSQGKVVSLTGIPQFKLYKSCHLNYNPNFSMDDPIMRELLGFFKRLFENPHPSDGHSSTELMDYVFELLSRVFDGEPDEKKVNMFKGPGDNGKTRLQLVLRYTFGDYYVAVKGNFFMQDKADAGAASPHVAKIRNARWVALSEPRQNAIADGQLVKQFGSPEEVDFRALFKENGTMLVTMRFSMFTNHFTPTDGGGHQAVHRFDYLPMTSKFVQSAPADPHEQYMTRTYLPDGQLGDKVRLYGEALLSLLVGRYVGSKHQPVEEVRKLTEQFVMNTDPIHMFWRDLVVELPILADNIRMPPTVTVSRLYDAYVIYNKDLVPRREVQPVADFEATLLIMGKKIITNRVVFISMREAAVITVADDSVPLETFLTEWSRDPIYTSLVRHT